MHLVGDDVDLDVHADVDVDVYVVNLYSSGFGVLGWYWPDLIGPLCQDGPLRSHYSSNYLNMPILVISNIIYLIKT